MRRSSLRQIVMVLVLVVIATPAAAKDLYLRCDGVNYLISRDIFGNNTIKFQIEDTVEWMSPSEFRKVLKDHGVDADISVNDEQIVMEMNIGTVRYDLIPYSFNESRQEGLHKGRVNLPDGGVESEQCTGRWVER